MTDNDPRGDAVAKLHEDLHAATRIPNDSVRAKAIERIHAAATIELVEAVRDLSALVALTITSTAPGYLDAPDARDSDAEAAGEADAPEVPDSKRLGAWAELLAVGDVLALADGTTIGVTTAGTSEGAAWIELYDGTRATRVFVDALAADRRVVLDLDLVQRLPAEVEPIVASAPRVDADADPEVDEYLDGDDEGGEFDVEV